MGLEVATYISELVATNPVGAVDDYATADDHLRLIKSVLQNNFPNLTANAVNVNDTELNLLVGLTAAAAELNVLDGYLGNTADLNVIAGIASQNAFQLLADIATATPPTTEAVTGQYQIYDADDDDQLMALGFAASNLLALVNRMHGGLVEVQGEDTSGNLRQMLSGNPDGSVFLYECSDNVVRLATLATGRVGLYSNTNTDAEDRYLALTHQDGTVRAGLGHFSDAILDFRNNIDAGHLRLSATDTGSTLRTLLEGDPDGGITTYYNGSLKTRSGQFSYSLFGDTAPGLGAAQTINLTFEDSADVTVGRVGWNGADTYMQLLSLNDGAEVRIQARDAGGTIRDGLIFDPDGNLTLLVDGGETALIANGNGAVDLYYNNVRTFGAADIGEVVIYGDVNGNSDDRRIIAKWPDGTDAWYLGSINSLNVTLTNLLDGGNIDIQAVDSGSILRSLIQCDPDGKVRLFYDGFESFRTSSGALSTAESDVMMGAEIQHPDQSYYPVGMNNIPLEVVNQALDANALNHAQMFFYNTGTARTITLEQETDLPIGTVWMVLVGPSGGTLTLDTGAGLSIQYWNGTGWTNTTGSVTLGDGMYTIWKETDINYYVVGPNIS